jgi:hypothetical protein
MDKDNQKKLIEKIKGMIINSSLSGAEIEIKGGKIIHVKKREWVLDKVELGHLQEVFDHVIDSSFYGVIEIPYDQNRPPIMRKITKLVNK